MNENNEAHIYEDWLTVENYQFKILIMCAVLAENHLAYRGKLKDMCEFLGVSSQTTNRNKIKAAIEALAAKGDIKYIQDGYTWTLTLSVKKEKTPKIIKLKNAWVKLIQAYEAENSNDSVDWEHILKVLVFLCADKKEIKRYDEIAKALNISEKTVKRSVKAIDAIDFKDIELKRKLAWLRKDTADGAEYKVIGQRIDIGYKFD